VVLRRITEGFNVEAVISGLEILRSIGKESALRSWTFEAMKFRAPEAKLVVPRFK
jgi:hypothetical protein